MNCLGCATGLLWIGLIIFTEIWLTFSPLCQTYKIWMEETTNHEIKFLSNKGPCKDWLSSVLLRRTQVSCLCGNATTPDSYTFTYRFFSHTVFTSRWVWIFSPHHSHSQWAPEAIQSHIVHDVLMICIPTPLINLDYAVAYDVCVIVVMVLTITGSDYRICEQNFIPKSHNRPTPAEMQNLERANKMLHAVLFHVQPSQPPHFRSLLKFFFVSSCSGHWLGSYKTCLYIHV
jgi:hypothetical protein